MNRYTLLALTVLFSMLFVCPTYSQTAQRYAFDNFDAKSGVLLPVEPKAPPKRNKKSYPIARLGAPEDPFVKPGTKQAYMPGAETTAFTSKSLDDFTTGDSKIDGLIAESGARNSVDPVLLYSIMHQESTFKKNALSPKGARGLMQLMPATAARFGVTNIFDPKQNIEGGARYVRLLLDMFGGDVNLALAGYNAGEGAVMRYGRQIPPYRETQEYVRRISKRYALMRDPSIALYARKLSSSQLASLRTEKIVPLAVYERNVFAVKLPDGRLQLVSQ
jgi:soluble lytic murein transglycosylase-like protein